MSSFVTQLFSSSRVMLLRPWWSVATKRWHPRGRIPQSFDDGDETSDFEDAEVTRMHSTEKKFDTRSHTSEPQFERRVNDYDDDDFDEGIKILKATERNRSFNNNAGKRPFTFRNKGDGLTGAQGTTYNRQDGDHSQFRNDQYDSRNSGFKSRDRYQRSNDFMDHRMSSRNESYNPVNSGRGDFNDRSRYRENYNEGYGPPEKRFDRQRQFNQQRNDFNRSQYRENYNEGYGPPEKRFEHRKQFDISHRQLNDLNMKKQFPKSKFKPESDDPYDKLFDNEDPNSDCLLLPNPYNLTKDNQSTIVNEIISPWYKYSYDHQLTIIQNQTADCLRFLGSKITKVSPQFRLTDRGYPCYLDPTVGSTETVEYRSRSEFSIWPGLDGDPKTVGYLAGKPNKHESVVCVEPDGALVLKKSHIKLTKLFQDYLRTKSPLEVCLNFSDGKNWRNLIVRSNDNGDHMVIAVLHPQNMTEEELESEKERIRNYFEPLAEEYQIKSFYMQTNNGSTSNFQLVFGMPVIEESLGSMKFVISPSSYFYVNKSGGEQLSKTVLKMLDLSQFQTVLDVSVGTGLLSLQTAPFVKKVIGAEPSDLNFGYACKNIELNNLTNVSIHNIKMQDLLLQQKDELWDKEVVVIANPQQDGFQSSILPQLRSMECVKRVVYITPRPPLKDSKSLRNLFQLMIPERRNIGIEGAPFVAINAVPYDIMPHNPHFGVIVNLERQSRFNY